MILPFFDRQTFTKGELCQFAFFEFIVISEVPDGSLKQKNRKGCFGKAWCMRTEWIEVCLQQLRDRGAPCPETGEKGFIDES